MLLNKITITNPVTDKHTELAGDFLRRVIYLIKTSELKVVTYAVSQ